MILQPQVAALQGVVGDASPEGQDLHQEGGSSGDTECHDTHPNADSRKLREEKNKKTKQNHTKAREARNRLLPPPPSPPPSPPSPPSSFVAADENPLKKS